MEMYEKVYEEIIVKENNGGGLQIEAYANVGEISVVICGLEMQGKEANALADIIGLAWGEWEYRDAGEWYDANGNYADGLNSDGDKILTAEDIVDDTPETKIIARYLGEKLYIYPEAMGNAGQVYFGLK